jgi:5'-3' exonuclease
MQKIKLTRNTNVILVDASYYVFYRYFATYRWFTFQNITHAPDDMINNKVFMDAFYKHVQNDLNKVYKKWSSNINNIVFCMDCMRCDIWRNDLYKDYKALRHQNQKFDRRIFPLFYDYISCMKIQTLNSERLEADDIIYLTQRLLVKQLKPTNRVIIISNDGDFMQLASDQVNVFNMQFKELKTRGTGNPQTDLLVKAIYGDKSDNIHKVASGITKDKAISIANMSETERIEYLRDNNMYDKFLFNINLISFENIPQEYVTKFNKNIKITFE